MNKSTISLSLAMAVFVTICCGDEAVPTTHRGAYSRNGEIHVGLFGHPDGPPLTTGHGDCKPSWSKTGDRLVFFRAVKEASPWRTAICVIKTDGTGFNRKIQPERTEDEDTSNQVHRQHDQFIGNSPRRVDGTVVAWLHDCGMMDN